MSDQITKSVLRYYGNIFGVAKSGPRMVELDIPITPILDVSRAGELGSGIGRADGWCCFDVTQVHGAGGTLTSTVDIIAELRTALPTIFDPSQHLAWFFESTLLGSAAGVLTSGFQVVSEETQGTNFARLWRRWNVAIPLAASDIAIPIYEYPRPVPLLGSRSDLTSESVAAAAGSAIFRNLFWIGSRGARAPFVA